MTLKKGRLKTYIDSNTTEIIRSRAKDCEVTAINLNPDGNSFEANVNGSSGIPYVVKFEGLNTHPIKSSCNCPFEYGSVCKHQVAVANETEGFFLEKIVQAHQAKDQSSKETTKLLMTSKNQKPKNSTTGPYIIPLSDLKNANVDNAIRKHASATVYREYEYFSLNNVAINHQKEDYLHLRIPFGYWGSEHFDVMFRKTGEELIALCNCKATNKSLCKHQAIALNFISEEAPFFLYNEQQIYDHKEALLQQYGFSLENPSYQDYFTFEYHKGNLAVIPQKSGLLRLSKFKDYQSFNENFLNQEKIVADLLPPAEKTTRIKKEKVFGIVFTFISIHQSDRGIIIQAIKGNSDKEKTDIVNKIEPITAEIFLKEKELYSPKQAAVLEKVLVINNILESKTKSSKDPLHRDKLVFKHFKALLPIFEENIIIPYETENYFYEEEKMYRRDLKKIEIRNTYPRLFFKIIEEDHFYMLKAFTEVNGKKRQMVSGKSVKNLFFFLQDKVYYPYQSLYSAKAFIYFDTEPELRINKNDFETYYSEFIEPLSKQFEVIFSHKKSSLKKVAPEHFKKQVYLSSHDNLIVFKPVIEYNKKHFNALSSVYIEENKGEIVHKIKRDVALETNFVETLKKLHSSFEYQDEGIFYLESEEFLKNTWFLDTFESLKQNDIEIFGYDKLSKIKYNMHKPSIKVETNSGIDWFDLEIEIKFGDQLVSLKEVRKSILKKTNYVPLKDGTLGILPEEWLAKYSHAFRAGEVKKEGVGISKYQLSVIDSLYDTLDTDSEMVKNHLKIKQHLASFNKIDTVVQPKGLKANLRNYQKEGLNWLNFLDEYNFGGCLADDMGLGKTLQIISFLKHLKNTKKPKEATLIVLPTSLIFNWQQELMKFSPNLKYINHTGTNRAKDTKKFNTVDIILTTYGLLLRDIEVLKNHLFNYIILDESQAIKNPNSQRFKSVRMLQSNNKLVVTGTPIENNTFDLYAQMTFVNPGLLGNMSNFKNEFATPIDKNKDTEVANDLRKLINPFLLRRTKEQVAKELPEKTEQVLYCTMDTEQQKLYDAYKNKYRDYLLGKIEDDGIGKSKMYVLEGLTKLRQICDSPQLLSDEEQYTKESIKIQELVKHITEKTGNHKILVFSQFVKMLSLIKIELQNQKIKFEYLDGKTKAREAKVENFQNNEEIRVFLISLKAGGTGLNLTSADYVYLVDPWWNPAVEAQAIDRCYRIGQTKKVMAYKMICKNTIEEKIINYQLQKKQLSDDIIQTDESFVKNLTKETIVDLFS